MSAGGAPTGLGTGTLEPVAASTDLPRRRIELGSVPVVALAAAVGLAICAGADALSRATLAPSSWMFWGGIVVICAPVAVRLCSSRAATSERLTLVCLLGLSLYLTKLMRDPSMFTLPDEFPHAYNAAQDLHRHALFGSNSILPVTARFPGLEGATTALMALTGMSSFGAGVIVVGVARLMEMVALFTLFSAISGSPRTAGLATAVYAGNSNFLLWGVQYAYVSLSLPLFIVALAVAARHRAAPRATGRTWLAALLVVIATIVVTHHLTSYILALVLLALATLSAVLARREQRPSPWPAVVVAVVLAVAWLVVVASATVGYITPVVWSAFRAVLHTAAGEAAPRALFHASGSGPAQSLSERIVSLGSVALIAAVMPVGLLVMWRAHRRNPFAFLCALGAMGFFGILALRLVPNAWETANRLSDFAFIGVAFVVACAAAPALGRKGSHRAVPGLIAAGLGIIVIGGAISGWPSTTRLAQPVEIAADNGATIVSEPFALGRFVADQLPGATFAAQVSDARTILLEGDGQVVYPPQLSLEATLQSPSLLPFEVSTLRAHRVRYVVIDLRQRSTDFVAGLNFSVRSPGGVPDTHFPAGAAEKFDELGASRVYDSGNILVYDIGALS